MRQSEAKQELCYKMWRWKNQPARNSGSAGENFSAVNYGVHFSLSRRYSRIEFFSTSVSLQQKWCPTYKCMLHVFARLCIISYYVLLNGNGISCSITVVHSLHGNVKSSCSSNMFVGKMAPEQPPQAMLTPQPPKASLKVSVGDQKEETFGC